MNRRKALAKFLDCNSRDIEETERYYNGLEYDGDYYMVLTDEEADEEAQENIINDIWTFYTSFIMNYIPSSIPEEVVLILQDKCEGGNEPLRELIGDNIGEFIEDAISADGRSHFLNTYDGEENGVELNGEYYYIYRMN